MSKSNDSPHPKIKYSKIIVSVIIVLNAMFAAAVLYAFLKTGKEPVALIAAWYSFTGGELWMLAGIKKQDQVNEGKLHDQGDGQYGLKTE